MGKVSEFIEGFDSKVRTIKLISNEALEYHLICNNYPMELSVTWYQGKMNK